MAAAALAQLNPAELAFDTALNTVVGLTLAQRHRLRTKGIRLAEELSLVDDKTLFGMFTQNFQTDNGMVVMRLRSFKLWVEQEFDIHGEVDASTFTMAKCLKIQRELARTKTGGGTTSGATRAGKTTEGIGKNWQVQWEAREVDGMQEGIGGSSPADDERQRHPIVLRDS